MRNLWHTFWMKYHHARRIYWHRRGDRDRANDHAHKAEIHLLASIFP